MGLDQAKIDTVWANDIDPAKREMYAANFPADEFVLADIRDVEADDVPTADLATASFPCTDLSLAGNRQGLGERSAPRSSRWESTMFWEFARVLRRMGDRRPRVVLCENVLGFANSNGGRDLARAIRTLNRLGYSCDVLMIDARRFVPQSRPRVFIVGASGALALEGGSRDARPDWTLELGRKHRNLDLHSFPLPSLPKGPTALAGYIEKVPADDPSWWPADRLRAFLGSLSSVQAARLEMFRSGKGKRWRTAYRRTRYGRAVWEIRADAIAGCLRTARGGSSKQALVEIDGGDVRVRWMTGREYANLMGAPDFRLADHDIQVLHGFGDAVCVPVITWLAESYLLPLVGRIAAPFSEAA
jgi:DNA (cytosine-5)-methyltransferase 1